MEGGPPDVRRYGEKEITKILRRASQMQRESPARPDPSGLTLAELEDIAREAGIDVDNLRAAAAELSAESDEDSWQTKFLGAPLTQRLVRRIPGELPAEAFGGLVPILQSESGMTGQASTVGNTLSWASTMSGNNVRTLSILVMAEGGETLVQLEERSNQAALGFHLGFSGGGLGFGIPVGLGLGATVGAVVGVASGIGVVGAFFLIGRALYGATTNARRRKVEALFGRLVGRVQELIAADQRRLGGGVGPALEGGGEPPLEGGAGPALPGS